MAAAFSRIALATPSHLLSWSGVILSAALSAVMRCSTVSGLLEVAAAAAGGLPESVLGAAAVWAQAEPAPSARAPATAAAAIVRPIEDKFMDVSFPEELSWERNGREPSWVPTSADLEAQRGQRRAHALAAVHRLDRSEPVQHPLGPGRGLHLVAGGELRHLAVIGFPLGLRVAAIIGVMVHIDALRQARLYFARGLLGRIAHAQAE